MSTPALQRTGERAQNGRTIEDSEKEIADSGNESQDIEQAQPSPSPLMLDWNGPDDPDNPWNWSWRKRYYHLIPPAIISFTATVDSSIYTPAYPTLMQDWNVSSTVALLPLTFYVLALGFGPLIAAPMSETYGRHIVYLLSTPVAALFTLGAGYSQNIWTLCILRFFAGLAFSPALSIGAGSIADVFRPQHRAIPSAVYILSPFLGPALGPVLGSFLVVRKNWRWIQWTIIFLAIFSFILTALQRETYKRTILSRRAKSSFKSNSTTHASPIPPPRPSLKTLLTITLLRPLHMLLTEPIVSFLSIYVSFNFSVLFAFFAGFPYVFKSVYDFSTEENGLVFLSIGVGCVLAVPTVIGCDYWVYQPRFRNSRERMESGEGGGNVEPEYRLWPAMLGSVGLPVGLFWFAWTARSSVSWASPVVAAIPFAWGNLSIFIAAASYLIDTYQALNGASAIAANGLLRYTLGAVFPLFTLQMYSGMGIAWATSLLGIVTVALMPIPWVLYKYGSRIRRRSAYETLKV